ncbi:MAG: NUDIX hydrolase [Pseudomonadota bacterium]
MQDIVDKPHPSTIRPRDAATLILVRRDSATPRVLMGKRHEAHKFMPGKFVFPGGRVDAGDCRITAQHALPAEVSEKLVTGMKGKPSNARATGIALAAVRETFEEVGLIIGQPGPVPKTRSTSWQQFYATGHVPDLRGLRMLARAITPPGRPRRFDTRFFMADAANLANIDEPVVPETDELLTPHWVSIDDALQLDLPWITGQILGRLTRALENPDPFGAQRPVSYQYKRGKDWKYETL